ncbi:MAG: sigma-70 family RNA polymerase sigma factor [Acidimicrobiales bacterium]
MDAGELYRLHAPAVRGYLRGQGVGEVDDVLSEVFLHVARSLPKYRGADEDLRRWVFVIARNRVIDHSRRRRVRPRISGRDVPEAAASPSSGPLDPELQAALRRLTSDQREVVVLRFVADLSLEEVAIITRRSAGAVKSMQHRALDQLARILSDPACAVESDD